MSHQPRRYFVVVCLQGAPRTVKGENGSRLVSGALEEVVRPSAGKPLLGWRTLAGADKHRRLASMRVIDREAGWSVLVYERRQGKLSPIQGGPSADLVVKNKADDRRARVYKHESGEGWDFDIFRKNALGGGWTVLAAYLTGSGESPARTRKEALSWVEDRIDSYAAIAVETVTEGWPEKEPPKPTKDAAVEIRRGQIWRQGSRRLIVGWVKPHWNKVLCPGEREVGYTWIDSTGRERGRAIVGRRARQAAHEARFREKFRFVAEPAEEP